MQAMILAAGIGSRLGHLTHDRPKCLIEISGKSVLEWNILKLKKAGISRIVINLHHHGQLVEDYLKEHGDFGSNIFLSYETDLLNTGGGIKHAESYFIETEPIVIVNADILSSVDILAAREFYDTQNAAGILVTRKPEDERVLLFHIDSAQLYGWKNSDSQTLIDPVAAVDQDKLIARGFCGIQIISRSILRFFASAEEKESSITGYLRASTNGQKVLEYEADEELWFDIGTPEQLALCQQHFSTDAFLKGIGS
ncbi:nucleotidyltransferase family protein [bacterium]|nr:nucleotidyltransferase family protein [bacterium]